MGTKAGTHEGRKRRDEAKTASDGRPPVLLSHTLSIALRTARVGVGFTPS